ncbi:hypothetical protein V2W45_1244406 [Cenococcum geophilum]
MQMPSKAVESIVLQLGQHQLSIYTKAPSGSILLYFYRYNSFSKPLLISLCYICYYKLKAYNVITSNLLIEHRTVA